jgi:hypothetical protein
VFGFIFTLALQQHFPRLRSHERYEDLDLLSEFLVDEALIAGDCPRRIVLSSYLLHVIRVTEQLGKECAMKFQKKTLRGAAVHSPRLFQVQNNFEQNPFSEFDEIRAKQKLVEDASVLQSVVKSGLPFRSSFWVNCQRVRIFVRPQPPEQEFPEESLCNLPFSTLCDLTSQNLQTGRVSGGKIFLLIFRQQSIQRVLSLSHGFPTSKLVFRKTNLGNIRRVNASGKWWVGGLAHSLQTGHFPRPRVVSAHLTWQLPATRVRFLRRLHGFVR